MTSSTASPSMLLCAAGLPEQAAEEWSRAVPTKPATIESDTQRYGSFWSQSARLLQTLPRKPQRNEAERAAAGRAIVSFARSP